MEMLHDTAWRRQCSALRINGLPTSCPPDAHSLDRARVFHVWYPVTTFFHRPSQAHTPLTVPAPPDICPPQRVDLRRATIGETDNVSCIAKLCGEPRKFADAICNEFSQIVGDAGGDWSIACSPSAHCPVIDLERARKFRLPLRSVKCLPNTF